MEYLNLNQFVIYAFFGGIVFFACIWAWLRDVGISWLASIAVVLSIIFFVMPAPTPAQMIVDAIDNTTLVIYKAIWTGAWLAGSAGVHFIVWYLSFY
jgi:hypothetical protein